MSSAVTNALRTAATLIAFTAVGTGLLAYTFNITKTNIAKNEAQAKRALIEEALPKALYDNDVVHDVVQLPPTPELGNTHPADAYRARLHGAPAALVLEVVAPDGYSGKINLLVAIQADGEIAGVRVVSHNETPGLGDYIDSAKSAWIKQFDHATLGQNDAAWKVKKDGGRFDYMSGATISPRAVVKAVHKALRYYEQHGQEIFLRPSMQREQP
jgi:electron transport complex protein RnfG